MDLLLVEHCHSNRSSYSETELFGLLRMRVD